MIDRRTFQTLCLILAFAVLSAGTRGHAEEHSATPEQLEFFEKEVRPLLAKHCYECHSTKAKRVEAKLLLDSRAAHLRGGDSGAAIVPGKASESLLVEAVKYESYEMPPKGKLSERDIATFIRWVDMGAPWPNEAAPTAAPLQEFDLEKRKSEFWVWQPIENPKPPQVSDTAWAHNDIDRFILASLEEKNLKPTTDVDRTGLLRRLYFDLIGLPPTPEEINAFLADTSDHAVEQVVGQLLDSPHFGERWGRHWLDLVRYAESRGHEFDNDTPNAFQYRDYVIRALNADVPYDQFVREHIAGDLLQQPRLHPEQKFNESVLGTGFWFLGEWVHSPVDIRKDESDRFDNMLDVMSKTFLGVTVACARCHDHKFDAISTADYYSLSGFLQSSDYRQVRFESMEQNRRVAEQLTAVNKKYQAQILDALAGQGLKLPTQTSYVQDDAIIVDYATLAQREYRQDGFIFGESPRIAGRAYLSTASPDTRLTASRRRQRAPKSSDSKEERGRPRLAVKQPTVSIATFGAAVNDPIWSGLESVTEGSVHNRGAVEKIPKSGRMLRSPTFEVTNGTVSSLIEGSGHVLAVVDSHRLIAGPLHGRTIRKIKSGERWVTIDLSRYIGHRVHLEFVPNKDASLAVRMVTQGLDAAGLAAIDKKLAVLDKPYVEYAEAAAELLNSGTAEELEERIFADFENGTYDGWTVTGDAFGKIPQTLETIGSYQGRINGVGKYFVNSHNIRPGGDVGRGDRLTGTLTSPEFTIDFDYIEFLVGGGPHKDKTCVNLVVDGDVAMSATGRANNQMFLNTWNVRHLAGKTARIQAVDNHTGGWGNVGLDHIVFQKATPAAEAPSRPARQDSAASPVAAIVREWKRQRDQLSKQIVRKSRLALAMLDGTGEDDHILVRGNSSKPGNREPRHFLTAVAGNAPMRIQSGSGRLELANQINDPANPLASRVVANRLWHHLMGRGIVATADDFGVLGQRPTHPELLDHLATRFLKDGRSLKQLIRYIVTSRTYQLSSHKDDAAVAADPKNSLWHHQPPKRLQGEVIRDTLLALSGRLDRTPFGPPVPIHLTSFMDGRGRPRNSGPLDGDGRRSIYISVRRNFLSPFMLTFDTPVPFSSMGRRNVSNVPAQALILMNDPFVAEQSRGWAQRAIDTIKDPAQRITWLYESAFARQPTASERSIAESYLSNTDDIDRWADFTHALVNTKEFIYLR